MNKTLLAIRHPWCLHRCSASAAGWLVCYSWIAEWDRRYRVQGDDRSACCIGAAGGALVDIMLKGFSLRGLSAITFGLLIGVLDAHLISTSPLLR